jgi:hypothetical protein
VSSSKPKARKIRPSTAQVKRKKIRPLSGVSYFNKPKAARASQEMTGRSAIEEEVASP